jgi:hypothetical protein
MSLLDSKRQTSKTAVWLAAFFAFVVLALYLLLRLLHDIQLSSEPRTTMRSVPDSVLAASITAFEKSGLVKGFDIAHYEVHVDCTLWNAESYEAKELKSLILADWIARQKKDAVPKELIIRDAAGGRVIGRYDPGSGLKTDTTR